MRFGKGAQRLAADEFRHQIAGLRLRPGEVVDVEDVGMVEARHCVRFAVETAPDLLAGMEVRVQDLHRYGPAQLGIPAPPDDGHAALADLLVEAVAAQIQNRASGVAVKSRALGTTILETMTPMT